jgi:hypothetical protein
VFAFLPNKEAKEPMSFIVKGKRRLQVIQQGRKAAVVQVSAFWCPNLQSALALHQSFGDGRSMH